MKNLIKIPYYLLISLVAIVGLLLLTTLIPIPGNFKTKIVKSGSMEPAIKTGGIVIIRPTNSYVVGDVITFGPDTKTQVPTTHRIVKVEGTGTEKVFITKGDANDTIDPSSIPLAEVSGEVILSLPYLGFMLDFARKPIGFILIVGVPALLVIFDELTKIWREIRRMRQKKTSYKKEEQEQIGGQVKENYTGNNILDLRLKQDYEFEEKLIKANQSYSRFKTLSAFLLIFVPLIGFSSVSSTVSYYNESESSVSNVLQAREDLPSTLSRLVESEVVVDEILETEPVVTKKGEVADVETETEEPIATEEPVAETVEQPPEQEIVEPETIPLVVESILEP